jgi:hypothetical protein
LTFNNHERFGNQDKRHTKNILEKEFQIKVKVDSSVCEPCMYGKALEEEMT